MGSRRLPRTGAACPTGLEFVIDLVGPNGSELLVDRPYNLYRTVALRGSGSVRTAQVYNRPWMSIAHDDDRWDTLLVETNRARAGRDRQVYPAIAYRRNQLHFARQADNSLADWYADAATGVIEVRLGWGMLHVMDPSSHRVLHGADPATMPAGTTTDGFRLVVQSYDPADPGAGGMVLGCGSGPPPFHYAWAGWEAPRWHQELKPLFGAMEATFRAITGPVALGPFSGDPAGPRTRPR